MIEFSFAITAVIAILQQLASPRATTYVNGIQMIDIHNRLMQATINTFARVG